MIFAPQGRQRHRNRLVGECAQVTLIGFESFVRRELWVDFLETSDRLTP